jgi:hypothetical protein
MRIFFMAKLSMVCVFDKAVGAYMRPMFVPSNGAAVRSFGDEVNRVASDNLMHHHPSDYELYHVGFFEEENAEFESIKPALLTTGSAVSTRV